MWVGVVACLLIEGVWTTNCWLVLTHCSGRWVCGFAGGAFVVSPAFRVLPGWTVKRHHGQMLWLPECEWWNGRFWGLIVPLWMPFIALAAPTGGSGGGIGGPVGSVTA